MQVLAHAGLRAWSPIGGLCVLASLLTGCVENYPNAGLAQGDVRAAIAEGQLHSPRLAAVALCSVEGAPDAVLTRLKPQLAAEAAARQITLADQASARYLVRGYLDAYPTEGGTTIAYVWDVFDATRQRTQRLSDTMLLPPGNGDPWERIDEPVLASIAGRSADDLAVFLAGTPEAAGSATATAAVAAAVAATAPLGANQSHVN